MGILSTVISLKPLAIVVLSKELQDTALDSRLYQRAGNRLELFQKDGVSAVPSEDIIVFFCKLGPLSQGLIPYHREGVHNLRDLPGGLKFRVCFMGAQFII